MGVFVRIAESGGKLEVSSSSDFVANKTIQVQFDYITEKALNDAGIIYIGFEEKLDKNRSV